MRGHFLKFALHDPSPIPQFNVSLATTSYYLCYRVGTAAHYYWVGGCVVMDFLNIFWFHKVLLGCIKLLRNGSKTVQVGGKND